MARDEIPIWAQVVSVVDVYDALVSPRVYKGPFPINKESHPPSVGYGILYLSLFFIFPLSLYLIYQ